MFELESVLPSTITLLACKCTALCPNGSVIRDWDVFP